MAMTPPAHEPGKSGRKALWMARLSRRLVGKTSSWTPGLSGSVLGTATPFMRTVE